MNCVGNDDGGGECGDNDGDKRTSGRRVGGKERESGRVTKEQEREGGREIEEEWEGLGSCSYF